MRIINETSRTLSEYLLLPNLTTEDYGPARVDLSAPLVKHRVGDSSPIRIAAPVTSAIMQAVSSPEMAIAVAQTGGISFITHNQSIKSQSEMIGSVKRHKAGFRSSESNVKLSTTLAEFSDQAHATGTGVAAVTHDGSPHGLFLGLISTQDFHPKRNRLEDPVESRMRRAEELVVAPSSITLPEANTLLWDHRLDLLPIVHDDGRLQSVVLRRDYELHKTFKDETIDDDKRFRVGAGVNTHDHRERIPALIDAGADVLCIDASDGYSVWQKEAIEFAKQESMQVPIGAGNVVDGRAFRYLADAGADFVKVGIGGGSICITRDAKGIGRGQASALADVVNERDRYAEETGYYVPICCDGGVLSDYHMAIAFAFGADFMMLGRYFARFDESPSRLIGLNGQFFKEYWGEGSRRAQNWSRYEQEGHELVFEEGVDGHVPYAGSLYDNVSMTIAKLKSTLASCGSRTLREFHEKAVLVQVSSQSYLQNTHEIEVREYGVSSHGPGGPPVDG